MHYCSVEKISKSYGIQPLFEELSFHINEGDRIALIAKNGTGKSTLLKILAGKEHPEAGKIWMHKEVTVIFFEQNPSLEEDKTVAENIFFHDHPVMKAIQQYEFAVATDHAEELEQAISKMDELQAWDADAKVKQILSKLNIKHLDKPVGILSGGQQKRVALAKTLIDIGFGNKKVLLIMEEPTNHLDGGMDGKLFKSRKHNTSISNPRSVFSRHCLSGNLGAKAWEAIYLPRGLCKLFLPQTDTGG